MAGERWKHIEGYEDYEISDLGRVRSFKTRHKGNPAIMRMCLNSSGYNCVNLCKNGKATNLTVHRLVARAFIGLCPDGMVVHHKDNNRTNNNVTNLECITRQRNNRYAAESGRSSALTAKDARDIRARYKKARYIPYEILAQDYNVSIRTIGDVVRGKIFRWLD